MHHSLTWTLAAGRRQTPPDRTRAVVTDETPASLDAGLADLSEPALVAACVEGRPGAFDLLVERHRRPVYQLCYRFVGNHEDASDLAQEVFIRAFRGLHRFQGQSSMATWLYRIGVNVCLNRVGAKVLPTEPLDLQPNLRDRSEPASDRLLRDERAGQVRAAVARLPRKQRVALVLRVYRDLSHQEIADLVGSSVGAVKANVFHALQNLKKLLPKELV